MQTTMDQNEMAKVTAAEFQKNFGRYRDIAQREAIAITNHGRESVVLISAEEYARFRALDERRAEFVWEMTDDEVAQLEKTEPPAEADAFNHEQGGRTPSSAAEVEGCRSQSGAGNSC